MKKSAVGVTDHAVLRYCERVLGIDVEAHRRAIGRKVDLAAEHPGACGVIVDGYTYKLRDGRVVTVIESCRAGRGAGRR